MEETQENWIIHQNGWNPALKSSWTFGRQPRKVIIMRQVISVETKDLMCQALSKALFTTESTESHLTLQIWDDCYRFCLLHT